MDHSKHKHGEKPAAKLFRSALTLWSEDLSGAGALGGLSGSPYSEAISWGKFVPPEEGGKFNDVLIDATIGLPLIVAAVFDRLGIRK